MVNLVDEWAALEQYTSNASNATVRACQIIQTENKTFVRVLVGKYGFEKEFLDPKDPLLAKIKNVCNHSKFLNVDKTIPDEQFFK